MITHICFSFPSVRFLLFLLFHIFHLQVMFVLQTESKDTLDRIASAAVPEDLTRSTSTDLATGFIDSQADSLQHATISINGDSGNGNGSATNPLSPLARAKAQHRSSLWTQLSWLAWREGQNFLRDKAALAARIGVTGLLNLFFAVVFYKAGEQPCGDNSDPAVLQTHFGCLGKLGLHLDETLSLSLSLSLSLPLSLSLSP